MVAALAGRPARDVILGAALRLVAPFLVTKPSNEMGRSAQTRTLDRVDPFWRDRAANIFDDILRAVFRLVRCNVPFTTPALEGFFFHTACRSEMQLQSAPSGVCKQQTDAVSCSARSGCALGGRSLSHYFCQGETTGSTPAAACRTVSVADLRPIFLDTAAHVAFVTQRIAVSIAHAAPRAFPDPHLIGFLNKADVVRT